MRTQAGAEAGARRASCNALGLSRAPHLTDLPVAQGMELLEVGGVVEVGDKLKHPDACTRYQVSNTRAQQNLQVGVFPCPELPILPQAPLSHDSTRRRRLGLATSSRCRQGLRPAQFPLYLAPDLLGLIYLRWRL